VGKLQVVKYIVLNKINHKWRWTIKIKTVSARPVFLKMIHNVPLMILF